MAYDFDVLIERRGTNCYKWDSLEEKYGEKDLLPFWVADMDFAAAEPIQRALLERVQHPVYGYSIVPESVYEAIVSWLERRHGWSIKREWISFTAGVVNALNLIIQTFTLPGEKVIVQPPVYAPFFNSVRNNGRQVVFNPLIETDRGYVMDLDDLEEKIDSRTRMLILCHPHNPVGRVWRRDELERLAEMYLGRGILMVSDEIHGDFIYSGHQHTPLASLSPEVEQNTITCMAPSKTFNLAGLVTSFVVIPNKSLWDRLNNTLTNVGIGPSPLGLTALEAAYRDGEEWLDELLIYLEGNRDFLKNFIQEQAPALKMAELEGTYLAWLDCRELQIAHCSLSEFFATKAKIAVNDGQWFGPGGQGFVRFNIGCPRPLLKQGLERIEQAVKEHRGAGVSC
ncbi:MAG: putative C-S lyase [Firmicutes bacterium]|nr:putative C-S lyase [Bacillota bacterium]